MTSGKLTRKGKSKKPSSLGKMFDRLFSLENEEMMYVAKAADAVVGQVLAASYERLGITWHVNEHGPCISAYSREHVLHHSDGLKSINKQLTELGVDIKESSIEQRSFANFKQRRQKVQFPVEGMQPMWSARSELGGYPVFSMADKRLEFGFKAKKAMSAIQAVTSGLAKQARNRVFNTFKLFELAIKGAGFRTDHNLITREIESQIQSRHIVLHRGSFVHAADLPKLMDMDVEDVPRRELQPLANYQSVKDALTKAETSVGLSTLAQDERDGVFNVLAGTSIRTDISTKTSSFQPVLATVLHGILADSDRDVVNLVPMSHLSQQNKAVQTVEAVCESKKRFSRSGSVIVLSGAQDVLSRDLLMLDNKASDAKSRLVAVYDPGYDSDRHPYGQLSERALRLAANPIEELSKEVNAKSSSSAHLNQTRPPIETGTSRNLEAILIDSVATSLSKGKASLVITSSQAASRLNQSVASALALKNPKNTRFVKAIKQTVLKQSSRVQNDNKDPNTYSVGDSLKLKRKTGSLKRGQIARIQSINHRAGFLRLAVGTHSDAKTVTLSLHSQSHHFERVDLSEFQVSLGLPVIMTASVVKNGLLKDQRVIVSGIPSDPNTVSVQDSSGATHTLAGGVGPFPISPGAAVTPDQASQLHGHHEVHAYLDAQATPQERSDVFRSAFRLDANPRIMVDSALMPDNSKHLSLRQPITQFQHAAKCSPSSKRLVAFADKPLSLEAAHLAVSSFEKSGLKRLNVTVVDTDGKRSLHRVTDPRSQQSLSGVLSLMINPARARPQERPRER